MSERRELGMHRRIARRDFLNGVAVGVAGLLGSGYRVQGSAFLVPGSEFSVPSSEFQVPPRDAAAYPPALTGLRGNYPEAVSAFGPMAQGAYRQFPALDTDTNETYDLVIVGAGISGLAAAHFWRRALGANQKVLILDNHDDFGGHAKRNEFTYQGRTFVGYGGTQSIATPFPYSYTAKRLVEELTIQVERNGEFQNRGPLGTLGPAGRSCSTRTTVLFSRIRTSDFASSSRSYIIGAWTIVSIVCLPGSAAGISRLTSSRAIDALPSGKWNV